MCKSLIILQLELPPEQSNMSTSHLKSKHLTGYQPNKGFSLKHAISTTRRFTLIHTLTSLQPSKLHCFSLYNYTNVPALHITYFRSTVGKFACSAAGPRLWNFLLTQECCKFSRMFLNHLRLHLKIHLFSFECLLSQNRHFTPKCGGMNL